MEAGLPWLFLFQAALAVAVGANTCVRPNCTNGQTKGPAPTVLYRKKDFVF